MGNSCMRNCSHSEDGHCCRGRTDGDAASTLNREQASILGPQQIRKLFHVDDLITHTLMMVKGMVNENQEPPHSLLKLFEIADTENGWIAMILGLVDMIPLKNSISTGVIMLLIDECPLPSKDAILKLLCHLDLKVVQPKIVAKYIKKRRNTAVVLGCLAEKLAGPSSILLLTEEVKSYLLSHLIDQCPATLILYSMLALEKFCLTTDNKAKLLQCDICTILSDLERFISSNDYLKQQAGFCAQWLLDNLFLLEDRQLSYKSVDLSGINCILNTNDVSEYLKISPNGLMARCDNNSFESVRSTASVDTGVWYYEVLIMSPGVMQIGWATRQSKFLNHDGFGIGDDEYSCGYDGCRQLIWWNTKTTPHTHPFWKPGDIVGVLLDINNKNIIFSLNGKLLPPVKDLFDNARYGFFAAASFMSFQQCRFNFGATKYRHPPKNISFQSLNDHGVLTDSEKIVLPRHVRLAELSRLPISEGDCELCYDRPANVTLKPCDHRGLCMTCAVQVELCPLCRITITQRVEDCLMSN